MATVLIDRNARTAIAVAKGRKLIQVVAMEEGELTVRSLTQAELDARGFRPLEGYSLKKAVRIYMRHSGGISKRARQALKGAQS